MSYVDLSIPDLALAALLLVVNGALSFALGLRFELSLAVAALRMVVQISAIGMLLKFVLGQTSPGWTALVGLVMVLVAAFELLRRQERRFRSWVMYGLGSAVLLLTGGLGALYAVAIVAGPELLSNPRYLLPVLGMALGNTLTSASLSLQTLAEGVELERGAIEARIALGATRFAAFSSLLQRAFRTATTPLIAAMALAGAVAMPDMMAGQILAGADPVAAARQQIMIMLVLAGAAALGALAAAVGGVRLLTDKRHRLRLDRLAQA
ncbi:MAG: ABC transporter permease [Hyphomicrobiaceae bacterium]|nr:MAG: ABC transporter permease [Hyphomicrobiaceae bacterium]